MRCPYCLSEVPDGATRCAACTSWVGQGRSIREWTRARTGRMIAGVCRGLANRFELPIAAVRVVFLLSIPFGGWGILAYLALWIAMPEEPLTTTAAPGPTARPEAYPPQPPPGS